MQINATILVIFNFLLLLSAFYI